MDISQIISEYGSYYLGEGNQENRNRLFHAIYQPTVTAGHFTYMPTTATRWRGARSYMQQVIQPWQQQFTPTDPLSMVPKTIDLYKLKIDLQENPDELEESWLGFLARMDAEGNLDRKQWPFIRWYLEEHVIPRAKEQMELDEIYWGIYAAPTPGTPGGSGTAMNGIKKKLDDYVTATAITPIVTGAPDSDPATFVGQLEDFVKTVRGANAKFANRPMELMLEYSNYLHARRGFRAIYGQHTDFSGQNDLVIDTNVTLVGLPSMSSNPASPGTKSNKFILSMKDTRLRLVKLDRNIEQFQVESHSPRTVDIYSDWFEVVDFLMPDLVWINDQA